MNFQKFLASIKKIYKFGILILFYFVFIQFIINASVDDYLLS